MALAIDSTECLVQALQGLIRQRDFLCLQLDHEYGNINENERRTRWTPRRCFPTRPPGRRTTRALLQKQSTRLSLG